MLNGKAVLFPPCRTYWNDSGYVKTHEPKLPHGSISLSDSRKHSKKSVWLSFLVKVGNSTQAAEPLSPLL